MSQVDRPFIYEPRERALVALADLVLAPLAWRPTRPPASVRRVLLLRLERIGDLVMVLDAIRDAREAWPDAEIDLAVGSWNASLARLIPGINRVHLMDALWLARDTGADSWGTLIRKARAWRRLRYDLVLNFVPDIRSNWLAWLSGARGRVGYGDGGGKTLLSEVASYDVGEHVSVNARRLVATASGRPGRDCGPADGLLRLPDASRAAARAQLAGAAGPLIGVHSSGGRPSKQWHLDRFAAVARELAVTTGGTIVLTGSSSDRPLVDEVKAHLVGTRVIDLAGDVGLPDLAALLAVLDVFVTGDTGPMHLASAVGTPVVALFGPSDPRRYGPSGTRHAVIRIDLPCSPCGQVRQPPERCRGHVPDCLDGIDVTRVVHAATALLAQGREKAIG